MTFKVLLVDDEAGILHSISKLLLNESIAVRTTTSAAEALDYLATQSIQVLVTDFQMPDMDGLALCREARQLSPSSYRIMLSGHVDYPVLRQARQQGVIHKFIAKPWNNLVLARDIFEGARQSSLMQRAHTLKTAMNTEQPAFLTDNNWVIRLANKPVCEALSVAEDQLLGRNLFANSVSNMPVALETEITRQSESNQTWLGYFNLIDQQRRIQPTWMAITPLSEDFRLCICGLINTAADRQSELKTEFQRYSGLHQLNQLESYLTQSDGINCILLISFDENRVADADLGSLCYERLVEAIAAQSPVFQPAHHLFLVPVITDPASPCAEHLQSAILQVFGKPLPHQNRAITLTPDISCEWVQSSQNDTRSSTDPLERIRQHLGLGSINGQPQPQERPQPAAVVEASPERQSDFNAMPVFDSQGALAGLELLPEYMIEPDICRQWLEDMHIAWQQHFSQPMYVILRVTNLNDESWQHITACIVKWHQQATGPVPHWCVILPWNPDDTVPELAHGLRQLNMQLLLEMVLSTPQQRLPGYRSLRAMNVDGFSLAPGLVALTRQPQYQERPLLQRLQQDGVIIYAHGIGSTEALAAAHQSGAGWLSGNALSRMVNATQLHWFAISD